MTTGWLIINIALIAVVAAIVAVPSVLIPHLLHRAAEMEHAAVARFEGHARRTREAASDREGREAA